MPPSTTKPLRIAHFGTFDVANYGDLLFPAILEHRLANQSVSITHVSPVGGEPMLLDSVPTISTDSALQRANDFDAVIIGGGQLIHAIHSPTREYWRGGISRFTAYPGLWLGASVLAARSGLPLLWNGPGAPSPFNGALGKVLNWSGKVSDYIALRSVSAAHFFREAGVTDTQLIPDTAWDVNALWSPAKLEQVYQSLWRSQGQQVPKRSIVFNLKGLPYGEPKEVIAQRLDQICRIAQAKPVLLGLGPNPQERELHQSISRLMRTPGLLVERPRSLTESTACLAQANGYFGSSFHGMLVAAAFGHPGIMVVPDEDRVRPRLIKCKELLAGHNLDISVSPSWAEAEARTQQLLSLPGKTWTDVARGARKRLDVHWEKVVDVLNNPNRAINQKKPEHMEILKKINQDHAPHIDIYGAILAQQMDQALRS